MLAFLDESGDTGRKLDKGSSRYFVVSLALFQDKEEALNCDRRIELLRGELGLPADYEFHFAKNSKRVRVAFLEAVRPYVFTILTVAINKDKELLTGPGFDVKASFYKYACQMVISNALPYLDQAILVIDKSGNSTFQGQLRKYLKNRLNDDDLAKIKKVKCEDSSSNNLLQLVDYCVGIESRKVQKKKDWQEYFQFINTKEIGFQIWPR